MSSSVDETGPVFSLPRAMRSGYETTQVVALKAELVAARAREELLLREMRVQALRQDLLAREFEHRLVNGLQLIASLLSLQSRTASPEAAAQLTVAASRVSALGRVHHRLHLLDHQEQVEFGEYLRHLCDDLSSLLDGLVIAVKSIAAKIPTASAIPLGFIVNELVTNSAKHSPGNIIVRFEQEAVGYSLSVLDDGPGPPAGFDPSKSKGLGMRIVLALVKQIGGDLHIPSSESGQTCFVVRFGSQEPGPADG
jgi:two-component system, sensor histidine kinase PdtaS